MSMFYYLNDDHTVRPCSCAEWAEQFESIERHVAEDRIDGFFISTVWLGNNHNYFGGRPLLFETMVFKGDSGSDEYCDRYATWDEAVEGHKKAVQWVKDGCKNED
tara:strand:- start:30019 stop:30333 length:315 start_codon:yes stop_codon:yes gene_type:complete